MKKERIIPITILLSYIITLSILSFSIFKLIKSKSEVKIPKIPNIEQRVTILEDNKKSILEYKWIIDNEEDLRSGKLKMDESPFSEEKTIYMLKTSMDSLNSFVYGSELEIEKQKCFEYNNFNKIRNNILKLNKPNKCK